MQEIIANDNQAGQRLDKLLHKVLPEASTSFLCKMLRKKNIVLNDKKAEGKEMLIFGDSIKIYLADETYQKFGGIILGMREVSGNEYEKAYSQIKGIEIVYEDAHVLICNKPSGVLSQKAQEDDISINEWFIGYLLANQKIKKEELVLFKPSICNRLDRNTSGLLLCGKSLLGIQTLNKWVKDRDIRKFYRLFVVGDMTKAEHIKGYLKKDEKTNKVVVSSEYMDGYDEIETKYTPLEQIGGITYVEVELITGKTHQIRAHLSSVGHPLLGDYKYGNKKINDKFKQIYGIKDQMLHAYRLEFPLHEIEQLKDVSQRIVIAKEPEIFREVRG